MANEYNVMDFGNMTAEQYHRWKREMLGQASYASASYPVPDNRAFPTPNTPIADAPRLFDQLKAFMNSIHCTIQPGYWSFQCSEANQWTQTPIGRDQASITAVLNTPNVYRPQYMTGLSWGEYVNLEADSSGRLVIEPIAQAVRKCIKVIVLHEMDENFFIGGERYFNPHGPRQFPTGQ